MPIGRVAGAEFVTLAETTYLLSFNRQYCTVTPIRFELTCLMTRMRPLLEPK